MAHCINPAMKGVYPAGRHATADRSRAQAERLELTMGHNSVLTCRDLGDQPITWLLWCTYLVLQVNHVRHATEDGARSRADQRADVTKMARAGIEPATP
jgi:hypothetical protein